MTETVLVVAAHADDEALGAGGTIARHTAKGDQVHTLFMADGVSSRDTTGGTEALRERNHSAFSAAKILGTEEPIFLGLPDNRMDSLALLDVIKPLESVIERIRPNTIYTHHAGDLNIDHQITHQAVITACRPQSAHSVRKILCFEVLSSTEWQSPNLCQAFVPNWFVDISQTFERKLDALNCYSEEMRSPPHTRSANNVAHLAGLRGHHIYVQYAEAFMLARCIV